MIRSIQSKETYEHDVSTGHKYLMSDAKTLVDTPVKKGEKKNFYIFVERRMSCNSNSQVQKIISELTLLW